MKNNSFITIILALLLVVAFSSCRKQTSHSKESSKPSRTHVVTSINPKNLPEAPSSPVLDLVGILNDDDVETITSQIEELDSLGWAQVAVVIVDDLHGYNGVRYATAVGKKWGVGRKDKYDGIVILVKPKTADSKGEAAIATGSGMQEILPDHTCKRIIDERMIPRFKQGDYGGGIRYAIHTITKLLQSPKASKNS